MFRWLLAVACVLVFAPMVAIYLGVIPEIASHHIFVPTLQFVTTYGLNEFIYYLSQYDANSPFGENYKGGDDVAYYDDDGNAYYGGDDNINLDDLPMCEAGNNGYVGLGCADDGTFSLQYYSDQYCLQPSGKTYDRLNSLNRVLRTYKSCSGIYYGTNEDGGSLPSYLIGTSESCSSLDTGLCTDNSAMKERRSKTGSNFPMSHSFGGGKTWLTKLKYATGGLLLLASFVMFTGILFTNRRRRRALMQRKYRQSRGDRSRRSKSGRSKSKSRDRKSSSRSRSRAKSKQPQQDGEGVFA
jgi:hypothetical protein